MLQTLPKEQQDDETIFAEPKAKKQRTSFTPTGYANSLHMARLIASHFDVMLQAIIKSSCKDLFVVAKSLVRIISCLNCEDHKVCVILDRLFHNVMCVIG